jgi:hypothetical protein
MAANAGSSAQGCEADLDGDGVVGVGDILLVLGSFGCQGDCVGDLDENGIVGVNDVLGVLSAFGDFC